MNGAQEYVVAAVILELVVLPIGVAHALCVNYKHELMNVYVQDACPE
ncbi:unnamed protein product, partial [Rotaria magnacalcarata]